MQRVLIAVGIILGVAGAGYLGYRAVSTPGGGGVSTPSSTGSQTGSTQTGTTTGTGGQQTGTGPITAGPRTVAEQASPYFAFRRVEVETSGDQPEACLVFTRRMDASGKTKYEDYLTFDPVSQIAIRSTEDRLCVAGLAFGQTYQLEIKAGLPSQEGEKIQAAEKITVELRDKPALVEFGSGLILPRESSEGVPVNTVNVKKLKLSVIRVGDRLLSQLQTGVVDQRQFYEYEASTLRDEQGAKIWSGEMDTAPANKNQTVTTVFPLRTALKDQKGPGVYMVVAQDAAIDSTTASDADYQPKAAQFVVDTAMGLTTFTGKDGLSVYVRNLASAKTMSGVELALVARNNEELQRVKTDSDGKAVFSAAVTAGTGGNEPVAVMAYGAGDDFAFLDLRRPAHDLTDRGVEGRTAPGAIDAYLYTERGIYRPGETIELVSLLRDQQGNALAQDTPFTLVLMRPDGLEVRRVTANDQDVGGVRNSFPLTNTAPRGRWSIQAYVDPKADPVGRVSFDVADFVPQKLKVTLNAQSTVVKPGETLTIKTNGRFLYGAPGSGLDGEGTATISADSDPFAQIASLKGFRFGKVGETFEGTQVTISVPKADIEGNTDATALIEVPAETTLPLKINAVVSLYEPGGRTTQQDVTIPLRTRDVMLGVRPGFEFDSIQEGQPGNFEVVAVDPNGGQVAVSGVTWELVKEDVDYQWFQQDNTWRYERIVRDRIVDGGKLDLSRDTAAKISKAVPWGTYRLTVADPASGAATSLRYWSGWGAGATNDRPDRVVVTTDKTTYETGDQAKLDIRPPSDGEALIVVASNRIHWEKSVKVSASGTQVSIPVSADWGAGAYAMVTHYKPLAATGSRAPARSVGVAWIGIDPKARSLELAMETPEKIEPRQKITVPVSVANAKSGEVIQVSLAAVDEGILQLTDFVSPDPAKFFLGKRRLGLDMRDDYGRLIEGNKSLVGELRTGGDGVGGRSLAVVPQKTVSLFAGIVTLDNQGKGSFTLDVPDFNGELRLMAVAYSAARVGKAEKPLTVRDAVVAELVLPRFLAPGDQGAVALNLHNVDGAAGTYKAKVSATGASAVPGGQNLTDAALGKGERKLISIPVTGAERGIGKISLSVEGPSGFSVARSYDIEVRDAQLPTSNESVALIQPGQESRVGADMLAAYAPGTSKAAITIAGARGFDDIPGQLRWLDRYPYGCLEQTTSRGMPLVHYNELAKLAGLKTDEAVKGRVQDSIYRVLDMQGYDGDFGMWSAAGDTADAYLGVFALDFLMQAKEANYTVPNEGVDRSLNWVRKVAGNDNNPHAARAYAFYLLAKSGRVNPSELRYYSDNSVEGMNDVMALGFLGAALTNVGDRARSTIAFTKARDLAMSSTSLTYGRGNYGSLLRDTSSLISMAAKSQQVNMVDSLVARVVEFDPRINYTTTQEKAWMILAAHAIEANAAPVSVRVSGADVPPQGGGKTVRFAAEERNFKDGVTILNTGQAQVWRIVSTEGIPAQPLPPAGSGVTLTKTILNLDGTPANLATVKQNDRMIVVLDGVVTGNKVRQMAILDLLPAGFEIEGVVQRTDNGGSIYPFVPTLAAPNVQEARDDRYVVTFTIGTGYEPTDPKERAKLKPNTYRFAYVARATIPGSYTAPAAMIEDMYAPDIMARTAMAQVSIAAQ